jgi:hypothetical protein
MGLDEYEEPKGAYYSSALVAEFGDEAGAEDAIGRLREIGFTTRDIQVAQRGDGGVTVVVSEPGPGMLSEARRLLQESLAEVRPYGSERLT